MAVQEIDVTLENGVMTFTAVDGNGNETSAEVEVGSINGEHVWLGTQSDAPTDEEIGDGNVALYFRADGNLYKRPYEGTESQVGGSSGSSFDPSTLEDGGSNELDLAGLSGDLADPQDPKTHGDGAHSAAYLADGDGTDRDMYVIANGASDPSDASSGDLIFERKV